jgi:thiol-disulfide isomerase/thioredoxin
MRRTAAVLVGLGLVLTGCGGGTAETAGAGPTGSATRDGSTAAEVSGSAVAPCPDLPTAAPRDDGLPDLTLPCLGDGPEVNLAHLRGVPTVVNVWAAWCTNCDREMPLFADAVDRYGDQVRFFGVHAWAARDYGLRSEADFGVPFPSVHDEDGDRVRKALRATGPPQTFYVDAEGRVVGRKVGEIKSAEEFDELVQANLGVRP